MYNRVNVNARVRRTVMIKWLLVALLGLALAPAAPAAPVTPGAALCFPQVPGITNCIAGRFRAYWEANGGLPVFGYPITPAAPVTVTAGTFLAQSFERARFELHP